MTEKKSEPMRIQTGVQNLDELLMGGLPKGSVTVIAGPPGSGKTILAQQICFHVASANSRVLYFNTLSEPSAKTLRHLKPFSFFDPKKLDSAVELIDLGAILRATGLEEPAKLILDRIRKTKPAMVVIDSFKSFEDLARSKEEFRKFGYELAVNLMAWEATSFLIGEFGMHEISTNSLFSIVDGLLSVTQREQSGEQQRFLQIVKMRGTAHSRDEHSFVITSDGVQVFAPRVSIQREDRGPGGVRCKTGISKLDDLLGEGIPRGSSLLIAGVAGTGKTVLLLEFLYRGALAGEKGIIFSFEETAERLRAAANGLGWDFDHEIDRGMIEIVFIPQPAIMVEAHLLLMRQRVEALGAKRVAVDSISVFLHKVNDPQIDREKVFQLASIIQNTQAVGFFATDIPYGANQLSRFGVEETVVDGVILLSSTEEGFDRNRYLEVYKLRNTAHLKGRHNMSIGPGGIAVFPRYSVATPGESLPPPMETMRRITSGVPALDALCGGGLMERTVTVVSGSVGIGKTTLCLQFAVEGAKRNEPVLYVSLDESPAELLQSAKGLGLPLEEATKRGLVELLYLPRRRARAGHLLAILDERVRAQSTRRLVIDSVSDMLDGGVLTEATRQLLFALAARFKSLNVTTLLTLGSDGLYSSDSVTELVDSSLADNVLLLRYAKLPGELRSTLAVLKTHATAHDRGIHSFSIAKGGIRIEQPMNRGKAGADDDQRS